MNWIKEAGDRSVLDVAQALRWPGSPRQGLPCPLCQADRRGRDKRLPVTFRGPAWNCRSCQGHGDWLEYLCQALYQRPFKGLSPSERGDIRVWVQSQGWVWGVVEAPIAASSLSLTYPPGAAEWWATLAPLDGPACDYLRGRGWADSEIQRILERDLVRLPTAPHPAWWPRGRDQSYRLMAPLCDGGGAIRSLQARAVVPLEAGWPKTLFPKHPDQDGSYSTARLWFAGPAARRRLQQRDWLGVARVALAEGLTDWLRLSAALSESTLVLGGVSGSFGALADLAIPTEIPVLVLTDSDRQGDTYAAQAAQALPDHRVLRIHARQLVRHPS